MLKEIILTKPWGDHASGEVVNVDPVRAAKLILDGIGVSADAVGGVIPAGRAGYRVKVAEGGTKKG